MRNKFSTESLVLSDTMQSPADELEGFQLFH